MSAGLKNYALILENFLWEALWINRPFGKWGTKRSIVEKITEGQERPKHHPAERGLSFHLSSIGGLCQGNNLQLFCLTFKNDNNCMESKIEFCFVY